MLEGIAASAAVPVRAAAAAPELPAATIEPESTQRIAQIDHPSMSLQLDAEIGIVVIELRSASGKVELSIPSQQQLAAYRANPLSALHTETPLTLV